MGDAGTLSVAAQDALTGAGVQAVTGAKTFKNQTLLLKNPADTFTTTLVNPAITANANAYLNKPYSYHIFKIGSIYYAMDKQGTQVSTGSTLDVVMSAVLALVTQATGSLQFTVPGGGDIFVEGGNHSLSGSFAGWDIPSMCKVTFAINSFIYVPSGYTGYVFKVQGLASPATSAGQKTTLRGGTIAEAGPASRLWTCILVSASSDYGVLGDIFEQMTINNAGKGIHLRVDSTNGWINGCVFRDFMINDPVVMLLFDLNGYAKTAGNGANRNIFQSFQGQAASHTTYGVKDIHGLINTFIDVKIWDMQTGAAPQVTANITANATRTKIYGGIMTALNYTDLGVSTFYDDDVNGYKFAAAAANNTPVETIGAAVMTGLGLQSPIVGPVSTSTANSSYTMKQYNDVNFTVQIIPFSDSRTSTLKIWNNSTNESFYLRKNLTTDYTFSSTRETSGGALRPVIFQMSDLVTPSTVESFRINTDATVKFTGSIQNENYADDKAISAPSSPATGYTRRYAKVVDSNNDGLFVKRKVNGAVVEVQL